MQNERVIMTSMRGYIPYKRIDLPLDWEDLIVEIGFGNGDFTVRLAKENPNKKVLGFEVSATSVEKLLKKISRENLSNLYCVRIDAYWGFFFILRDGSVEKIYMNYPDPWFKKKHHKRRLTSIENLYMFAKKLNRRGSIIIRSDYLQFLEYTIENLKRIGCFSYKLNKLSVEDPLTKYERKWLSQGKELFELILEKSGDPEPVKIREVRLLGNMFPVKVKGKTPSLHKAKGKEFKEGNLHVKFFRIFSSEDSHLVETLISEDGFVQKFFIEVRKKDPDLYILDVSGHSEVLKTEGIRRAVELLSTSIF